MILSILTTLFYTQCFALYLEYEDVGKQIKTSKKKITWKLGIGNGPEQHDHSVSLKHSVISGKKEIYVDGRMIFSHKDMFGSGNIISIYLANE